MTEASSHEKTVGLDLTFTLPEFFDTEAVSDAIVELVQALDDLHRAKGGSGLRIEKTMIGQAISFSPKE